MLRFATSLGTCTPPETLFKNLSFEGWIPCWAWLPYANSEEKRMIYFGKGPNVLVQRMAGMLAVLCGA